VRLWPYGAAIAAMLAVATGLVVASRMHMGTPVAIHRSPVVDDVSGDGVVDIRDAMVLHQRLKGRASVPAPWDARVALTEGDVQRIGEKVVRIAPPVQARGKGVSAPLAALHANADSAEQGGGQ
jgi:hypothetical protein